MTNEAVPPALPIQSPRRTWLWQPNLIAFISSACIMILELDASRIIAPIVGSSLYTWTSVIGIVLAGIMLGNYLGGRLADRWASLRFLGIVYVIAAITSLSAIAVDPIGQIVPPDIPIVAKVLVLTTALFFIPCAILGMISPILAKLAVSDLAKTGSTVGKIYAAGAFGSIVGTFATGFYLISWFGSFTIIIAVALLLLAIGAMFILGARLQSLIIAIVLVIGGWMYVTGQGWQRGPCMRETNYYCIKIVERQEDGESVRELILDHLVHSYVSLNNPTKLVYPYEQAYAEMAQYREAQSGRMDVLMIGGGGYTFARFMEAIHPTSSMSVIEIDPGVTQFAYDELALRHDTKVMTYNEDARLFFARQPNQKYDLILGDAFNHFSMPYHITTKEFNERVRLWLKSDGVYMVNIIDGPYGEFFRAYYNTLRQTFRYVYLAEGNSDWKHATRSMFLLMGSDAPIDMKALANFDGGDGDALLARMMISPEDTQRQMADAPVVILTDQYAPVDQMLASVFREQVPQ